MTKKSSKDEVLEVLKDIAGKTRETHEKLHSLDKKIDLHVQRTELELTKINELDAHQNMLLDEHIAGVNTLRELYVAHVEDNDLRFAEIEAPRLWAGKLVKYILLVGSFCSGLVALLKILEIMK